MNWQPIETAPKDETAVLVWMDGWDPRQNNMEIARYTRGQWRVDTMYVVQPTHWAPLPEAPK